LKRGERTDAADGRSRKSTVARTRSTGGRTGDTVDPPIGCVGPRATVARPPNSTAGDGALSQVEEDRKYVEVAGEQGGFGLTPSGARRELKLSPVLDDLGTIWDTDRFAVPRVPVSVGRLQDERVFSRLKTPRVSNIPVKFPGSDYRIPREVRCVAEALQVAIDCEHAINPDVDDYYAYLTVDRDVIMEGYAQRGTDVHADWLQGTRYETKRPIDHGYLVVDRDPPLFFDHPFTFTAEDIATDAYISVFNEQARYDRTVSSEPYEVVLFDAYSVHAAVPASETKLRTFMRLFYSVSVYDRAGDTRNALFDYDWAMETRHGSGRRAA
jgi:hypothetical protein